MSRTMSPSTSATSLFGGLTSAVFTGDSWKLAIPASLYVLQNSLQYFAISNLDAAIFQVTYQFKILPTALFSVILLGQSLSLRKWLALALLMFGVAIVQLPAADTASLAPLKDPRVGYHFPWSLRGFRGVGNAASAPLYKRSATYEGIQEDDALEHPKMNTTLGVAAALMGCTVSSLASVYFEKILKDAIQPVSLWVRNVQLAFYSMFPALFIGVFYANGEKIAHNGFFAGYNWAVWVTLLLQAVGGMVVSLCLNYADNIAKSFAMGISILISLCASVWFFEFKMTRNVVVGTSLVLFATYLYNLHERGSRPAPLRIHEYEKTTIDPKSSKGRSTPMQHPATPLKSKGKSSSRPNSPGRHHSRDAAEQPHLVDTATAVSSNNYHAMPYSANLQYLPGSRSTFNEYHVRHPNWDTEDYEAPLHALDQALHDEFETPAGRLDGKNEHRQTRIMQEHQRGCYLPEKHLGQRQSSRSELAPMEGIQTRLSLRQPFQTPPSQLLAEPSSPAYPPPSSPLARVVQRREVQASQPGGRPSSDNPHTSAFSSFRSSKAPGQASTVSISQAPPIVQGIQLVSTNELPDRFRSVFPFALFNAVQSKCYGIAYKTSDNLVLSAPTGSGKTVILELSICQLMSGFQTDQFKIVYMAPTKSLCTERQKDWQAKFTALDLQCAELTGDTDQGQLRNVQNANIIITTPEKWDSMTRKWKDHAKLMQLVKLFLIDEVHILNESRGACLEAVVSRMKSVGSNVRFVALSATVPNSEDIAIWLGQNSTTQHLPAHRERFGEDFRPVKLQKHVYGLQFNGNDWGFEKVCDPK
ncbi:MAG: hypothetical protein Q9225_004371 [Loekoesia sp. 1 TL-2023]